MTYKKRTFIIATALICLFVFAFSGCTITPLNAADKLVRAPKLSGDDGELQKAFESSVLQKSDLILRYPSYGEYRGAYIKHDCNGDGIAEAFVFYSFKSEEMTVHMATLKRTDSGWRAVSDVIGDGTDVKEVYFEDLDSDNTDEILVGWSSVDNKSNKKLSIYSIEPEGSLKTLSIETYSSLLTDDFDLDGKNEIFLTLVTSNADRYSVEAKLLKLIETPDTKSMTAMGKIKLFPLTTSFGEIKTDMSNGRKRIFIDEVAGDTYLTEVVYWDKEQNNIVKTVELDVRDVASSPLTGSICIPSRDIDGDGQIEIASTKPMPNAKVVRNKNTEQTTGAFEGEKAKEVKDNTVYVVEWNKITDDGFKNVARYFENEENGLKIAYDREKFKDILVTIYPEKGITQFSLLKRESGESSDSGVLFTLYAKDVSHGQDGFILNGNDGKRYICNITKTGADKGWTEAGIEEIMGYGKMGGILVETTANRGR